MVLTLAKIKKDTLLCPRVWQLWLYCMEKLFLQPDIMVGGKGVGGQLGCRVRN